MNKNELKIYIGNKIREYRKLNKKTQKELGELVGVKHNTIATYEKGDSAPDQKIIFRIAQTLNRKVDDFFPAMDYDYPVLNRLNELSDKDFIAEDMMFLRELVEKTLSLDEKERAKFLDSIKFTVDYYERMKD